jgi:hypothetical protein
MRPTAQKVEAGQPIGSDGRPPSREQVVEDHTVGKPSRSRRSTTPRTRSSPRHLLLCATN